MQWAYPVNHRWQLVELFSGQGNVSAAFRAAGKSVCSFDKLLHDRAMDFDRASGFLLGPFRLIWSEGIAIELWQCRTISLLCPCSGVWKLGKGLQGNHFPIPNFTAWYPWATLCQRGQPHDFEAFLCAMFAPD